MENQLIKIKLTENEQIVIWDALSVVKGKFYELNSRYYDYINDVNNSKFDEEAELLRQAVEKCGALFRRLEIFMNGNLIY